MLFVLLGCSSTPFIYPPSALRTVDLSPPEEGEGAASVGATMIVGESAYPDIFGGFADGAVAVGLPHDLDVSARAIAFTDTVGGAVSVGWTPLRRDTWEGGLALGIAASNHRWQGSDTDTLEDGTSVVTDSWDYTYWSLAPAITVRQAWKPTAWFRLPAGLRYSHAFATGMVGDHPNGSYYIEYFDGTVGPEFIAGPARFGLDLSLIAAYSVENASAALFPIARVGMSMEIVFPLWGEPVTRAFGAP